MQLVSRRAWSQVSKQKEREELSGMCPYKCTPFCVSDASRHGSEGWCLFLENDSSKESTI